MALTLEQKTWLNNTADAKIAFDYFDKLQQYREAELAHVRREFAKIKPLLEEANNFAVEKGNKIYQSIGEDQLDSLDATEYVEFEFHVDNMENATREELEEARGEVRGMITVAAMRTEGLERYLLAAKANIDGSDVDLFTVDDVEAELYTPMSRMKLIAETFIDNKYSQTFKLLDGSNKAYMEGCKDAPDEQGMDAKREGITLASKLTKIGANLLKDFPGDAATVGIVLEMASVTIDSSGLVYDIVKNGDWANASDKIIDNIGLIFSKALSIALDINEKDFMMGYNAATSGVKVAIFLTQGDIDNALNSLATGFDATMSLATQDTTDPNKKRIASTISISVSTLIKNAGSAKSIAEKAKNNDLAGVVDGFTKIAQNSLSAVTTITKDYHPEKAESIDQLQSDISKGIEGVSLGFKVTASVVKAGREKEFAAAFAGLVDDLGAILESSLKLAEVPGPMAQNIKKGYDTSTSITKVVAYLSTGKTEEALAELGNGIAKSLELCFGPDHPATKAGSVLGQSIAGLSKAKQVKDLIEEGKYLEAQKVLLTESTKIVLSGLAVSDKSSASEVLTSVTGVSLEEDAPEGEEGTTDDSGEEEEPEETVMTVLDDLISLKDSSDEQAEAVLERLREREEEEALQELMAEREEDILAINKMDARNAAAAASSVDKLIAKMQRDKLIMDMAVKVANSGLGVASKFCPALEAVNAGIKLAANLVAAAERAVALNQWIDHHEDLINANSALFSSAMNFVDNQKEQFSHYSIQASLELAQMIGAALSCSGIGAAAGEVVSKVAAAASSAEELIYQHVRKSKLEDAWKVTKASLRNPENRRLGLEARKMNPTLAKYTVAYAAVVLKDPLGRDIAHSCGITETTLRDEKTNVNNVAKYFQAKYPDDLELIRKIDLSDSWMPKDIELSVRFWSQTKQKLADAASKEDGPPALDLSSVTAVDDVLATAAQLYRPIEGKRPYQLLLSDVETYQEWMEYAETVLKKVRPKDVGRAATESERAQPPIEHDGMHRIVQALAIRAASAAAEASLLASEVRSEMEWEQTGEDIQNLFSDSETEEELVERL